MQLFPLFLKLEGRPCLVVGAGRIAAPKIASLLRCGARVRVVAPEAAPRVRAAARAGRIHWEPRKFRNADLQGAFLVVAATNSSALHERIFRLARRAGILCNSVDEPSRCDFYYPAVVRRGSLQIAISTGGNSPSLAARLRRELERQFGPGYAAWVGALGKTRAQLLARAPAERRSALLELSSAAAFRRFRRAAGRNPRPARKRASRGPRKARAGAVRS